MAIDEEIARAIGAHNLWAARIRRALESGKSDFKPEDVAKDSLCTFGKWLNDPKLSPDVRTSEGYREVCHLHTQFHQAAGATMAKALAGDAQAVANDIKTGLFADAAQALFGAMFRWQRATTAGCGRNPASPLNRICMILRGHVGLRLWTAVAIPSLLALACLMLGRRQATLTPETVDQMYTALAVVAVAGAGVVAWMVLSVSRPLTRLADATRQVAQGTSDIDLPSIRRADAIGDLARATLVFQQQAVGVQRVAAEREQQQAKNNAERRNALIVMAANIESQTTTVVGRIAEESTLVHNTAKSMAQGASSVEENAQLVAAAAEQSLSNAETVAGATEKLSASIREIAGQVERSRAVVGEAVQAANKASATVADLTDAMMAIDHVAQLIAEIASQTNLLALNATIEAARAGDAGKGFAVVANEVKLLATQTARQTEEISQRILTLKEMAARVHHAIDSTVSRVKGVETIATSVAVSVETQDAATKEIARSVQQSAHAAREVTDRIVEVADEAISTGKQAGLLEGMLHNMAAQVAELRLVLNRVVRTATPDVDRRGTPRYAVEAEVALIGRSGEIRGELTDISLGGARVKSDQMLAPGEQGTMRFDGISVPIVVVESANGFCRVKMQDGNEDIVDRWIARQKKTAA
jgi:methyl-accepting chemotaxis protein